MSTNYTLYPFVSRVLGLALITAGFLKAYDYVPGGHDMLVAVGSILEVVFGLWLLAGLFPRFSWLVTAICFIAFLGISMDKALAGESSCGCFGRVAVPPWYTVAFDSLAILGLACSVPKPGSGLTPLQSWRRLAAVVAAGFVFATGVFALREAGTSRLAEDGEVVRPGDTVVLSPDGWIGRSFPLARHIDMGERLRSGEWVVMFYHADCPRCRDALPLYVGLARQLADATSKTRVALIEMPPLASNRRFGYQDTAYLQATLSDRNRWVIQAPHFLLLRDGVVARSTDSPEVLLRDFGATPALAESAPTDPYLFPDYRRIRRESFLREIACGPLALVATLSACGVPVGPDETDRLIASAGNKGIDLLLLKQLTEQHGLHAIGVEISPDKLRQMGHKAIVRMNQVGFAAVTGFTPDGVRVALPMAPSGVLPDSVFDRMFGDKGVALLVSETPFDLEKLGLSTRVVGNKQGPHLLLSKSMLAAGRFHRSDWQAELTITNDGSEPLVIYKLEASCPCFSAVPDAKEIPPGGSTTLRAKGTETRLGGFTYSLTLTTNETPSGKVIIPVRGYLEQPVGFEVPARQVRGLIPGQPFQCEVGLDIPPTVLPEQLWVETPKGSPLTADVRKAESGRYVLAVRSDGAKEPGWHRWQIRVFIDNAEKLIASPFHLAVEVVPPFDLLSPAAYVPDSELGGLWTRQVVARPHRDLSGEWKVNWSDPGLGTLLSTELSNSGNALTIVIKAATNAQPPYRGRAELVIESPNGEKRSFVLYLGVAAFEDSESRK